jgi:serine/threonine protein kinase
MSEERKSLSLPANSVVGRYQLRQVNGCWGFYLTYLAEENGTGRRVLVHELVPEELVERAEDGSIHGKTGRDKESFAWARMRFLREGRALAACSHPSIQKTLDVIEANGTAYWVTPTDEPRTLKGWKEQLGHPPTEEELRTLLRPLLAALQQLHGAGLHHLNLKLDSIQVTPDGAPVLVHFAGARQDIARHSHEAGAVTPGYSPIEQYDDAKPEGPWTDIYSLAAVLHRLITGQLPPEATTRLTSDPYQKLTARFAGKYHAEFLSPIDAALAVDSNARPQSIEGWRKMLGISAGETSGRHPKPVLAPVCAAILLAVIAAGGWCLFRPKPTPSIKKDLVKEDQNQQDKEAEQKKAEEEKKLDEEKKAEEAKTAEEKRKSEEQKLAEAEKKAKEENKAAEKAAEDKAATAKEADAVAKEKEEAARTAEEKAEGEEGNAAQAARKVDEAKGAAKKRAAEKAAADASEKAAEARREAGRAATESAAANVAAKQAELDGASAEKTAAEKDLVQKSIELQIAGVAADPQSAETKAATDQATAAKASAERTLTERTAAEKEAADQLAAAIAAQKSLGAKKVSNDNPSTEKSPAEKAAEEEAAEKAAAEKAAADKAAAEKAAAVKAAAEMAAKKVAEEKAAAEKSATDKIASDKAAADKAAAEKAAKLARKQQDNSSLNQNDPPPLPPSGPAGQVGSGLGGVWETTQKDANGKPLKRLIIYPDAQFQLSNDSGAVTGVIQAKLGVIKLRPDGGSDVLSSSFTYKSMSVIETDGALGKLEWTRVSANTPDRGPQKGK